MIKLQRLITLTMQICILGVATTKIMQQLSGCWIAQICFRRVALCLMDEIFTWTNAGSHTCIPLHKWRRISPIVIDELTLLCVLAPFWFTDLTAGFASEVFCSDATLHTGCVTKCDVGPAEQVFLWSRCPRRAGRIRLSFDEETEQAQGVNTIPVYDELLTRWVRSKSHHLVTSYKFKKQRHINIQECLAWRTSIKRAARNRRNWNTRLTCVVDSTVA